MKGYSIVPVARIDLRDIVQYIGSESPSGARKVRDALFDTFASLASQPGMGHLRPDLTDRDLRFCTVLGRYMIVYGTVGDQVQIVRVFGPGRDVATLLNR